MSVIEQKCVCGNCTVLVFPPAYIEEGDFRCWMCPPNEPTRPIRPTLQLVYSAAPKEEAALPPPRNPGQNEYGSGAQIYGHCPPLWWTRAKTMGRK